MLLKLWYRAVYINNYAYLFKDSMNSEIKYEKYSRRQLALNQKQFKLYQHCKKNLRKFVNLLQDSY